MEVALLIAAIAGIGGYLFLRLCMYLGRPVYLQHTLKEVDEQYTTLLRLAERDLESAIESYNGGRSDDSPSSSSDKARREQVDAAREARDHEREVNDKFLRLRIRFAHDLKKQMESAAAYRAYLRLRLYKEEFASREPPAGAATETSPEDRLAYHQERYEEARKIAVALEESEKKLDALLA